MLPTKLAEWRRFYNWERPHDSLGGVAPIDRLCDLLSQAPAREEIAVAHDPATEFILPRGSWPNHRPQLG